MQAYADSIDKVIWMSLQVLYLAWWEALLKVHELLQYRNVRRKVMELLGNTM